MDSTTAEPARQRREVFQLDLRPLPGDSRSPIQRLRSALKALRRSYGLECVRLNPAIDLEGVE